MKSPSAKCTRLRFGPVLVMPAHVQVFPAVLAAVDDLFIPDIDYCP